MNRKVAISVAAIVAAVIGLGSFLWTEEYIPTTDELTFERSLDNDEGRGLNPAELVSTSGVRLTDVFSPTSKTFTPDRLSRYGADRNEDGGVGLTIKFVQKDGANVSTKTFQLPGWGYFEETTRPVRRLEIIDAGPRLADVINSFAAPVPIKRAFGIALDTTEGVQSVLAKRVRQVIDETRALALGSDPKNSVVLNLYNITESPYQGGREQVQLTSSEESIEWLLKERPGRSNSSVLGGLKAVVEEMAGLRDSHPTLHIFTDGLENTDIVSVYRKPELLDEVNWATLDQVANLAGLKLAGLEIHLHPLPAASARQAAMIEKGLFYLADRLKKAGAGVTIEPL